MWKNIGDKRLILCKINKYISDLKMISVGQKFKSIGEQHNCVTGMRDM